MADCREMTERAKKLRRDMTKQERRLWYDFLRAYPMRFMRQRPISGYIADFYCASAQLVIEVDGGQHFTSAAQEYDKNREDIFRMKGISVMRFTNAEIDAHFYAVCEQIDRYIHNANNSGGRE